MSTISVGPIYFAAGHRILGLSGPGAKCRNLHGHTFGATWTYQQDDKLEFGQMKHLLKGLIKCRFDHLFFCDVSDDLVNYLQINSLRHVALGGPPTTERIAETIARASIDVFTKPVDEYTFDVKTKVQTDEVGYFPDSQLLSLRLTEGPENTATWINDQPKFTVNPGFYGVVGGGVAGQAVPGTTFNIARRDDK